jgi:hypothetical protein
VCLSIDLPPLWKISRKRLLSKLDTCMYVPVQASSITHTIICEYFVYKIFFVLHKVTKILLSRQRVLWPP